MELFVSYNWTQKPWIDDYLIPALEAAGHTVHWDKNFKAGTAVKVQMDAEQDKAEKQILCFSPEYLKSKPCKHEMNRALALDPSFATDKIIPLKLVDCQLPQKIKIPNPIYVALDIDQNKIGLDTGWASLAQSLPLDLGVNPADWLRARDKTRRFLTRQESVNLVVTPRPGKRVAWRALIRHLGQDPAFNLSQVDFDSGIAASRQELVREILEQLGQADAVPEPPRDLAHLTRALRARGQVQQAWLHFTRSTKRGGEFNSDFYGAIRNLVNEERVLTLLIHSQQPIGQWMEQTHQLSHVDFKTVTL